MQFEWDPEKDRANRLKHGLSFSEASQLFSEGLDFLEISGEDDMSDDIRELTGRDFARAIPRRQRERIAKGKITSGKAIVALRRFTGMTQLQFAHALGISVHTVRSHIQRVFRTLDVKNRIEAVTTAQRHRLL